MPHNTNKAHITVTMKWLNNKTLKFCCQVEHLMMFDL